MPHFSQFPHFCSIHMQPVSTQSLMSIWESLGEERRVVLGSLFVLWLFFQPSRSPGELWRFPFSVPGQLSAVETLPGVWRWRWFHIHPTLRSAGASAPGLTVSCGQHRQNCWSCWMWWMCRFLMTLKVTKGWVWFGNAREIIPRGLQLMWTETSQPAWIWFCGHDEKLVAWIGLSQRKTASG